MFIIFSGIGWFIINIKVFVGIFCKIEKKVNVLKCKNKIENMNDMWVIWVVYCFYYSDKYRRFYLVF